MKRNFLLLAVVLLLGILIGIGGSYFAVMRGQSQIIETMYAGGLADRVILAARLRAGQQDKVVAATEAIIPQGILGVREFTGADKLGRYSLVLAKTYYDYVGLEIPTAAQPILADVTPLSRQSFEKLRDISPSSPR